MIEVAEVNPPVKTVLVLRGVESDWSFQVAEGAEVVLGRTAGADLRLTDLTVARRHARIVGRDGHWSIEDLRSHCGVFVNGLQTRGVREVRAGDLLRIGRVELRVDVVGAVEDQ